MRKILCMLMVVAGFCACAQAESFVVTKDGKGLWVWSTRKDNDKILYIDKETGDEKSFPAGDVEAVIPKMKPGTPYPLEQVNGYVSSLKALEKKHQRLKRILTQLLQEWESFLKEDPGLEKAIDDEAKTFKASDKLTKAYKGAVMNLGMLKYKDAQGKYAAKIDTLVQDAKKDYYEAGFARLEALSATNKINLVDFIETKELVVALSEFCDAPHKEKAGKCLEKARQIALRSNTRLALDGFATARTVNAYLSSLDLLHRSRVVLAAEEIQQKAIDTMMSGLARDAGRVLPAYKFDYKGYPLTANDRALLNKYQNYSSRVSFSSERDEQCLVFPLKQPERIRLNSSYTLPLRLVFNRLQPPNRKYSIWVYIPAAEDGGGPYIRSVPLENVSITNGHAEATFTFKFEQDKDDFIPGAAEDGKVYVYLALEGLVASEGREARVLPLSCACRLGM